MVGIMFKRQPLTVMIEPAAASVQIGVRGAAGSVWGIFFGESLCPEFSVRLELINFPDPKFAVFKVRTSPQRIFNVSLWQRESEGRFFALRLVDGFNLFGFGGNMVIEET